MLLVLLLVILGAAARQGAPAVADDGDPGQTTQHVYLPLVADRTLPPPLPPPEQAVGVPPVDFPAIRATLQAQGQDLAFVKVGFHVATNGNIDGLYDWMTRLDAAGVPFFLKSVDNAEPLYIAQQLRAQSGVPHVLVYRRAGDEYDVPNYDLPPETAAAVHWERHKSVFPPELDPNVVWIETVNEVDKGRSEWLGRFALETAQLALADGFRWAAFGWSSGEPEDSHWETHSMLAFLRLAAARPDRLAVALHEYSYTVDDVGNIYPFLIGRFQSLFRVCDQYNIGRPTVLITEWGWEYENVPEPAEAMEDIRWASWLYAAYPEVKGAAIWYLGGGFGGIADKAQRLIAPMTDYAESHYFVIRQGRGSVHESLLSPGNLPPPPGAAAAVEGRGGSAGPLLRAE
jgi:hypothetical protein